MTVKTESNNKQLKKTNKVLRKIIKGLGLFLFSVLLVLYVLVTLLNTTLVQSFAAAKVADYFSKQWNTKVAVGALNISPFITVGIKDLYIEDLQKDTLVFASRVEVNLSKIKSSRHIVIKNVKIEDLTYHLTKQEEEINIKFIIDYFKSDKKKEKKEKKEPFILEVKKINLTNIDLRFKNQPNPKPIKQNVFSVNYIDVRSLNLQAKDFILKDGDILVDIEKLSLKERCGIVLKNFKGKVKVSPQNVYVHNSKILTENSQIKATIDLNTDSYRTYSHFADSVYIHANIYKGSYVGMRDATYFADTLKGANQKIYLCSNSKGKVSDLTINDLEIKSNNTFLKTNGTIKGLTKIKNTIANLTIENLTTSYEDIKKQSLGSITDMIPKTDLLDGVGNITLKGEFQGKIDDFYSKLNVFSDVGALNLVARAEPIISGKSVKYTADVESEAFNVGKLLGNALLGNTSFATEANIILSDNNKKGELSAKLRNFYFKGNVYDKVRLQGTLNNYDVNFNVGIYDKYALLQAEGEINYEQKPNIKIKAQASQVDLHNLHLYSLADTNTIISADIFADMQHFDINNLNGKIELKHLNLINTDNDLTLESIGMDMQSDANQSNIKIESDVLEGELKGKYTFETLQKDFICITNKYLPNFSTLITDYNEQSTKTKTQSDKEIYNILSDINFNLKVKDTEIISQILNLNLATNGDIDIKGRLNEKEVLRTQINIPHLEYATKTIDNCDIRVHSTEKDIFLNLNANLLTLADSVSMENLGLGISSQKDKIVLLAKFQDAFDQSNMGRIAFNSYFSENGLQGSFSDTYFSLMGKRISVNNEHFVGIQNKSISLMNLGILIDDSKITLDGLIADKGSLTCNFENVDISLANLFLEDKNIKLQGVLNNNVIIRNINTSPTFTSNLKIDDLAINSTPIGKAWLNVSNALTSDVFSADIRLLYSDDGKEYLPLQVTGTISPQSQNEQMNLSVNMEKFDLFVVESFLSSFASDLEGNLSCKNLNIRGNFSSPIIEGKLHAENAAIRINMLNTKYYFTDDMEIDGNKLIFDNFVLTDAQNNKITIKGDVSHKDFSSFDIDLRVVADKIKILDTKEESDQMYYGLAYASAVVLIKGDSTMIDITGSAKTEPGTSLTVPISSKEAADENNFIFFTSQQDSIQIKKNILNKKEEKTLAYNVSLDLNVNPSAKLNMPIDFSQVKGDLTASGNGDIKIEMNSLGKLSMVGTIAIDNGKFRFNIADVMEKTFDLQQGGTLIWNGDPAQGVLDITAIYRTNISLASLLGENYSKPVGVESIIRITGQMTNPQPSFDIQLPNTDEQTREQVFMNIDRSDEKVLIEQTASILLTNQFYLSQGGYQNNAFQSGVTSSVMGMAFSQLSGVLSNMVKFVDVGLNYTSGDETYGGQMDVDLSKSFGKWDLSVNASFGGDGTTSKTSETTSVIGDVSGKYKFTENFQFEAFNRSNANDFTKYNISPYTQGARIIYKRDYNSLKDIFRKKRKKK